ncbi:unnamed protein product [Polarella glacialis]|uniref:Uncharacterized protein n=1 Tax=Polarella glacialis TaxID=89957 RepID=A0A813GCI4_POLGL|nr:unnamed protein product [Polarella glacialis]
MAGEVVVKPPPCFTLVCLRRLEQEVALDDGELSVSHDRRVLSRVDSDGRCFCYSCDRSRPAFSIPQPVVDEVQQYVWQHIPAETHVRLDRDSLAEYPGVPCLVALGRENAAITFCRFLGVESPDAEVREAEAKLADDAECLERGGPLLEWCDEELSDSQCQNTIWRHRVPLASLLRRLPACREYLATVAADGDAEEAGGSVSSTAPASESAPAADWFEGEEAAAETCRKMRVRICTASADTLVLFLNDAVAAVLRFSWRGITASHCFFLQRPSPALSGPTPGRRKSAVRFCDVAACRDYIFAVTPQPEARLLIWHSTGVAFHAVELGSYLPEDVHFEKLALAQDLLAAALSDTRHRVWVLSLDRYFGEGIPQGLDWDLLKERYRCSDGVGVVGQTSKLYQELTAYPEAFGLRSEEVEPDARSGGGALGRRLSSGGGSVMDCLVEGVSTYGIPLPGGAYGIDNNFFGPDSSKTGAGREGIFADGGPAKAAGRSGGRPGADAGISAGGGLDGGVAGGGETVVECPQG